MMKKFSFLLLVILFHSFCSCVSSTETMEKIRDLSYTIVSEDNLPVELHKLIAEKKESSFQFTYKDNDHLYICIGYGMQNTGGYSICVNQLYLNPNAIFVNTNLIGPSPENLRNEVPSYPYIVLKTELINMQIIFD